MLGPEGAVTRYLISTHEQVIDVLTEHEIKNVFKVSSLPRALVLRKDILTGEKFLNNFGNRTIYVGLFDTGSETYYEEFGL